jgi:hypothetical protein
VSALLLVAEGCSSLLLAASNPVVAPMILLIAAALALACAEASYPAEVVCNSAQRAMHTPTLSGCRAADSEDRQGKKHRP